MSEWISIADRLPEDKEWYLVFCPWYCGGSSSAKESADGVMFSKFNPKSGKWSIETAHNPHCVRYWQSIIMPKGHAQKYTIVNKGNTRFPYIIRFETEEDFLNSTCEDNRICVQAYESDERAPCMLGGHEVMPMYVSKFDRMAYIPIFLCEGITFPCDFELLSVNNRFCYSVVICGNKHE